MKTPAEQLPHVVAEPLARPQFDALSRAAGSAATRAYEQRLASQEARGPSAEEIEQAFKSNRNILLELGMSTGFQQACVEKGVDPDAFESVARWNVFADYTRQKVDALIARGGKRPQLKALELMASTPQYIYAQYSLHHPSNGREDVRRKREVVSGFNNRLRAFATEFPAVRVSSLERGLLEVVSMAVEHKEARQMAAEEMHQTIRGAQHEMGFGQLLAAAGRHYREATLEEDLRGIDYVDFTNPKYTIAIDVKSATTKFDRGKGEVYRATKEGVVMYSLLQDHEFHNSFYVSPDVVQMKAPAVSQLLERIEVTTA